MAGGNDRAKALVKAGRVEEVVEALVEGLRGEGGGVTPRANIHGYPMSLTSLECQVSELANSDTCPRPTTRCHRLPLIAAALDPHKHDVDRCEGE